VTQNWKPFLWWGCCLAVCGVLVSPAPGQTGRDSLRVVTYNIRHGRGMDDQVNLRRIGEVLQRLNPDIVALQEVDQVAERSGGVDQAKALAAQLGLQSTFGPFMDFQGGQYGMAILSRYPILKTKILALPEGNEPRIALAAELQLPDSSQLLVINVHFDWVRDDRFRWAQAQAVKQMLDTWPTPYLLLGDFNDQPESRTIRMLAEGLREAVKPENDAFTFSSTRPEREIDYIFAGPAARWNVRQVEVVREPMASDHRPVVATMILK
jgi:endonuclease/exonuclease/phosphatase family metal-dependent hydrolase